MIQCKCVLAYTLHIFNPYCKKCGIEMHFNYRDDAKHYLQKNLEFQIDFLNDCRKLQRIKLWRWYKQHMFMQARKHFLSFINKISRSASKSTKKHIFYILPKKIKKFENRIKLYSSYFEDGVKLFKYIFPKAMKIPFLSSIFIIILASSCDVLCHWIFCYWLYGWSVTSKLLFSEMKS